jgi:hypothetical protein
MSDSDRWDWWFGEDDLSVVRVGAQAQWREHPFDALENGKGLTLYRRNEAGEIDRRDAAVVLQAFVFLEAERLTRLWDAPEVVREYLLTGNPRLSEQAGVAVKEALEEAELETHAAAQLVEAAKARCPTKLGFFARATVRVAAQAAARDYAQAVAAYHHRQAATYAIGAAFIVAFIAVSRCSCLDPWYVADAAINTAGLLAAEEGVIITPNDKPWPQLLPPGVAEAAGQGAERVNIRSRFAAMVQQLFA